MTNRDPSRLTLTVLAASAALLFAGVPALGQRLGGFEPTGDFLLEVNGVEDPGAKILRSREGILVVSSKLTFPVLLSPRTGSVQRIGLLKVAERADGVIDLLPDPVVGSEPAFSVEGADVLFSVADRQARIKPKPPLLGFQQPDGLRAHSPEYGRLAEAYTPSESILQQLRSESRAVRVQVFFGTWCPACGQMVPRIMKVAERLNGSKIGVDFYGLPRQFAGNAEAERYDIHSVPTAVVFVDGKEVGRISGNDWKIPELALSNLLVGS